MKNSKKVLNLYWKTNWLRRLLNSFAQKIGWFKSDTPGYFERITWSFVCGDSIQDALFYDFKTPEWIKRIIDRIRLFVII